MRPDVLHDFDYGRQFLSEIRPICGQYLIAEAPFEEDAKRGTDLIVLKLSAVRIAVRIRRPDYLARYPDDFTLRCERSSGAETELGKIIAGWGDYMFYGFGSADGLLAAWLLGDLHVFRRWWARELWQGRKPGRKVPNGDGTFFRAFDVAALPDEFVVARQRAGLA
jgi:hypothetical protein